MDGIRTAAELYAHAIAIEREAAERYAELARRMAYLGNQAAAKLFERLASLETEHLQTLLNRTAGVELPRLPPGEYCWFEAEAPETAARELVFLLMTPRHALEIALGAEQRAQEFFEHVFATAADPALRALAQEMAAEEREHVRLVEDLLARTPDPHVDWAAFFAARERGGAA